jgi:spore coat protein SA
VRICHVAPELLPVPPSKGGAIERWIRDAAVRLVGRGHDVHVISRDRGDGAATDRIDGVQYHYIPVPAPIDRGMAAVMFRGLNHYRKAKSIIRSIAPDVVHHHSRPAGVWLSDTGKTRNVISLHSMDYGWSFGYAKWDRRLFERGFAAATRVLAVSNFIREHTAQRYPSAAEKSSTVYNGVDGSLFTPATAPDDPPILYVGRVEERKGVHVLLDAFEQVISKQRPRARLRIVGPQRTRASSCAVRPTTTRRSPRSTAMPRSAWCRRCSPKRWG